jgi:RimJ/RimL family protein N-acetyltransferase
MAIEVREMTLPEAGLVIDYFHHSSPEHLEMLGVDPTRLPAPAAWHDYFQKQFALPLEQRSGYFVTWLHDGVPAGFSSCDKIVFGERANMHLHVTAPERRQQGLGTECVRRSVAFYFARLKLKRLFCEPNAFNVGPNRTLQRAGFNYVKTHWTVPGPLNFHQAVTRWVYEPSA